MVRPDTPPPSDGWDSADTVTSLPETPRAMPAVQAAAIQAASPPATQASPATAAPATPASPGTTRGPYPSSPGGGALGLSATSLAPVPAAGAPPNAAPRAGNAANANASNASLGPAMREEVWAIVRAAVDEAVKPLVTRQRELEARLEQAERARSIPVALGPSVAPPAIHAQAPPPPRFETAPISVTNPGASTIPDLRVASNAANASGSMDAGQMRPRMASIPPTGYGVSVTQSTRPQLDLSAVGPVDIDGFDGGARKRKVAGAVVVLMVLIIIAVVTMTLLSHS